MATMAVVGVSAVALVIFGESTGGVMRLAWGVEVRLPSGKLPVAVTYAACNLYLSGAAICCVLVGRSHQNMPDILYLPHRQCLE